MSLILAASRRAALGTLRRGPVPAAAMVSATLPGARVAVSTGATRQQSTLKTVYQTIWRSNATYITYVLVGCVVIEVVYGKATDALWDWSNKGKQYKDIDWSKFKSEEEEEEEGEEEEEEEEE